MRTLFKVSLLSLLIALVLPLVSMSASASGPSTPLSDIGMQDQVMLIVEIKSDYDLMDSGGFIPMKVLVKDQHGVPVPDVAVEIIADGARAFPNKLVTDSDGTAKFTFTAETETQEDFLVVVAASKEGAIASGDKLKVTVFFPPPGGVSYDAEVVSISLGAMILAVFASTEFGRYGIFKTLIFPLYTRLKKEEVLDHFVRGQIYGYILSHPGQHYNFMRQELNVTNGTLSHHLRTLEMQGFIKSMREGIYKRFYPVEMRIPQKQGVKLSDLQLNIMHLVRRNPGATQGEIAKSLGVSQQGISYNVRCLSREGMLRIERDGRQKRYYPLET